jgi:hypothetical protein
MNLLQEIGIEVKDIGLAAWLWLLKIWTHGPGRELKRWAIFTLSRWLEVEPDLVALRPADREERMRAWGIVDLISRSEVSTKINDGKEVTIRACPVCGESYPGNHKKKCRVEELEKYLQARTLVFQPCRNCPFLLEMMLPEDLIAWQAGAGIEQN